MNQTRYCIILTSPYPLPDAISRHRQSFAVTLEGAHAHARTVLAMVDRTAHPTATVTIYETVEREVGKVGWGDLPK